MDSSVCLSPSLSLCLSPSATVNSSFVDVLAPGNNPGREKINFNSSVVLRQVVKSGETSIKNTVHFQSQSSIIATEIYLIADSLYELTSCKGGYLQSDSIGRPRVGNLTWEQVSDRWN